MYYLITIQNKTTANILGYEDEAAALSKFYTEMSYGVSTLESVMCQLIGDVGNVIKHEYWQKKVEESTTAPVTAGTSTNEPTGATGTATN